MMYTARLEILYGLSTALPLTTGWFLRVPIFCKTPFSAIVTTLINATSKLSFKLLQWISLTASLRYNKVNRNNRENLLLTFGVTAERYF